MLRNVSKTFPGTRALIDVDFDVRNDEIHALVGQNGSGKSTLVKTLAGVHTPDEGADAWMNGEPFDLYSATGPCTIDCASSTRISASCSS